MDTLNIINEKMYSSNTPRVPLTNKETQSDILQTGTTLPASVLSPAECLDRESTKEDSSQDIIIGSSNSTMKENYPKSGFFPNRDRTLLIVDIVRGIQPKGLDDKVYRYVCSGAILTDIERKTNQLDLTRYKHVIIFVGGNDVSSGKRPDASHSKLLELTRSIQHQKC
jgi:hypothetical protein